MALTPTTSQGSKREKMSAGQHPARLAFIKADQDTYDGKTRDVFVWRWDHMKKLDAEDQPLVIWCRTNQNFGDVRASLTQLLRQIFGSTLTEEEVQQMDLELLVGQIEGYVLVQSGTNTKGEPIVKWGGYVHPEKREYPDPSAFFVGVGDPAFAPPRSSEAPPPTQQRVAPRQAPPGRPPAATPPARRAPAPVADTEFDDLEDPFAG